jgi:hypothetical protein
MIGVANVAAHGQSQQLSHKVVFQFRSDDLPFIAEIFRTDEPNHAVYQERIEHSRNSVGPRFQRQLINPTVSFRGKCAPLAGLEVHHVLPFPPYVALGVMFENSLAALLQHRQGDAEAAVSCFGTRD